MSDASLTVLSANVVTLNPVQPQAKAIAVRNGKIVAVGSNAEIRKYVRSGTKVIDGKNRTVVPGLVDCHVHMTGFGFFLQALNLKDATSIEEVQRRLRTYADEHREKRWILEGRWDQEGFVDKRYPTRWDLDAAVADRPVFLVRVCGHIAVANSKALQLAGITRATIVKGGKVDLDSATGQPSGIIRGNALRLLWRAVPKPTMKQLEEACVSACRKAAEAGLTCVHWLVESADEIRVLRKLCSEGRLPIRVRLGVSVELLEKLDNSGLLKDFRNDMLRMGFVKILSDGSLGARTAALKNPYSDKPDTNGIMLYTQRKLNQLVSKAHEAGLQLGVHAIGDRAVEATLKAFERALERFPRQNHRHRIEHCSVLNPKLIRRMKQLGLIASVQPIFADSDFWIVDRVGKNRARWVYPFKTLMKEGVVVAAGSDCPVEDINPLRGVSASVARRDCSDEALAMKEALETYTSNAAYASFDEDKKGSIEVGKVADFTILSDDLFKIQPYNIKEVTVKMTIVDGKIVYSSEDLPEYQLR